MDSVIEVDSFGMSFGDTTVIDNLNFDVKRGETFGLLGSNGSGKTTTVRALLDIYQPTRGRLMIEGKRFHPSPSARLGYLPEERGLYRKESVIDVMTYFGQLKGLTRADAASWSMSFLDQVGLVNKSKMRIDKLSGGQQQKVQLGVTIMNNPSILILDEPTKGFDPVTRRLLLDILDQQKAQGCTIIFISHQMEEVERLCDRILLLKNGRAEAYGSVADVQKQYGGKRARINFCGSLPTSELFRPVVYERNYAELELGLGVEVNLILRELLDAGVKISSFDLAQISMEEIFLRVYGDATK